MKKLIAAIVCLVLLAFGAYTLYLRHQIAERDAGIARQVEKEAVAAGGVRVEVVNARDLVERLSRENRALVARLQRIDKRVAPTAHIEAVARIEDTVVLDEAEHRFKLLPDDGDVNTTRSITRKQKFRLDGVVLQNVDGSRLGKLDFVEVDPVSGEPYETKPELETRFEFVKESPDVPVLHPRVVAGIESHGYPIAGLQVLNGERYGGVLAHINSSVFGGYNIRDKTPFGGAVIGYRPWNWNVSFGPAVFVGKGGWSAGAAATIEITR